MKSSDIYFNNGKVMGDEQVRKAALFLQIEHQIDDLRLY
jgi:orotate phosphoribosyltransferase